MPPRAGTIAADASLAQARKNEAYFKKLLTGMSMHEGMSSVREADYKGHHIVIETTYVISIDGKRFEGALGVTDGGDVHYHGMPNVGFPSAVDLVKAVIDTFPGDFDGGGDDSHHDHPDEPEHHHHGGMTMSRARKASRRTPRAVKRPGRQGASHGRSKKHSH